MDEIAASQTMALSSQISQALLDPAEDAAPWMFPAPRLEGRLLAVFLECRNRDAIEWNRDERAKIKKKEHIRKWIRRINKILQKLVEFFSQKIFNPNNQMLHSHNQFIRKE